MGVYNTYDGVQLKVAKELYCGDFKRGQKCDLKDGLYLGCDGFVVIEKKKVLRSYKFITNSHKRKFSSNDVYMSTLGLMDRIKEIVED